MRTVSCLSNGAHVIVDNNMSVDRQIFVANLLSGNGEEMPLPSSGPGLAAAASANTADDDIPVMPTMNFSKSTANGNDADDDVPVMPRMF